MTLTLAPTETIPGYTVGTWKIDPVHSEVSFTVKHMMVSKVRGVFRDVDATIRTAEDVLSSSVEAEISVESIDTGVEARDGHIRSADFFDAAAHPTISFRSTGVRQEGGDEFVITGDLTLKGITRPVELQVELNGFTDDPYGGRRMGLSAKTTISRNDFGVDIKMPMDGGGMVVGEKVTINLEIEAVLQTDEVQSKDDAAIEGAEATLDSLER